MNVGENIRIAREKCGLSQEQLAEMIGVSQVAIHKYETGAYLPNAVIANSIAKKLHTTVGQLVDGDSSE